MEFIRDLLPAEIVEYPFIRKRGKIKCELKPRGDRDL